MVGAEAKEIIWQKEGTETIRIPWGSGYSKFGDPLFCTFQHGRDRSYCRSIKEIQYCYKLYYICLRGGYMKTLFFLLCFNNPYWEMKLYVV